MRWLDGITNSMDVSELNLKTLKFWANFFMPCIVLLIRISSFFFHILPEALKKAENHQSRGKIQTQPARSEIKSAS